MSQTSDERFRELAMKLVSFECSAEEKAELRRVIDKDPARREELRRIGIGVGIARELLPLVNAMEAIEGQMSQVDLQALKFSLAQRREQKRKTAMESQVVAAETLPPGEALDAKEGKLTEGELQLLRGEVAKLRDASIAKVQAQPTLDVRQMEALALRILAERPMDGPDLAAAISKAGFSYGDEGEGVVYGILSTLESQDAIEGHWQEGVARMSKTYRITETGTRLLNRQRKAMVQLDSWATAVLAAAPPG